MLTLHSLLLNLGQHPYSNFTVVWWSQLPGKGWVTWNLEPVKPSLGLPDFPKGLRAQFPTQRSFSLFKWSSKFPLDFACHFPFLLQFSVLQTILKIITRNTYLTYFPL